MLDSRVDALEPIVKEGVEEPIALTQRSFKNIKLV